MKKILFVALIFIMIFNLTLTCYAEQIEQLKIGIKSDEGTLTPYTYVSETGATIFRLIYDPLFNKSEDLTPEPWLVKEYKISEDGTVYSFKLHDNVKWHDGKPLTAEDVKFTFEYLQKYKKSRFSGPGSAIKDIKIKDNYSIEMTLTSPQPEFLTRPLSEMGILPKHIWQNITTPDSSKETIGSGPYKLVDMKDGEYYKFEANNEYFKAKPAAKQIYMPIIKDSSAMFTALKAGQIDATATELPPETVAQFKNDSKLTTIEGPGFSTTMICFNNDEYPLDNKNFREALAYATNSQEIVDVIMLGSATPGSLGFVHPMLSSYNDKVNKVKYDIQKSNSILDELNFKDTDGNSIRETDTGKKLSFELLVYANNPLRIRTAELIKDSYSKIGVEIIIKGMDMAVVDDLVWPGFDAANGKNFSMTMWGWGASTMGSSVRYVETFHSDLSKAPSNFIGYKNKTMDEILDKMLIESNLDKRIELQKSFQEILSNDYPCITLYYPTLVYAYNPKTYNDWKFIQGAGIINNLSLINRNDINESKTVSSTTSENDNKQDPLDHSTEDAGNKNIVILAVMILAAVIFIVLGKIKLNKK